MSRFLLLVFGETNSGVNGIGKWVVRGSTCLDYSGRDATVYRFAGHYRGRVQVDTDNRLDGVLFQEGKRGRRIVS